jgi:hypothetical protein
MEVDQNYYKLFGVVSFGRGCAQNFPGIYARLAESYTLNWINQHMKNSQGDVCSDPVRGNGKRRY